MKPFYLFLMLAVSRPLFGQATVVRPPEVEVERMRIEAEERARREMERRDWEMKIFPIKHADANQIRQALVMFRAEVVAEPNLRVISVRAPKEIMPAVADAIKMLDVPSPSKSVELTIYLLMASDDDSAAKPLPSQLQPVVNQLKNVLSYKTYQLIETMIARGVDGRPTSFNGTLPAFDAQSGHLPTYSFSSNLRIEPPADKGPVLKLSAMDFRIDAVVRIRQSEQAVPGLQNTQLKINTNIDVPAGQQVVVGKATLGDRAFILVMNAKFLD